MERRKYPRIPLRRAVLWRSASSLDNLDQTRNISEDGLCIAMGKLQLQPEDFVNIEFQLPTRTTIRTQAQVRWIGPGEINDLQCRAGLEFINMDDAMKNEMRYFVGICRYGCD